MVNGEKQELRESGVGRPRSGSAEGLVGHQRVHRGSEGGAYNCGRHLAGAVVEEDKGKGRVRNSALREAHFLKLEPPLSAR